MPDGHPVVFFSRCKPKGVDAAHVALENRIIFFGWAMRRHQAPYNRHAVASCIVDPSCSEQEWQAARREVSEWKREYQRNRNFVRNVPVGSIAMIPRPAQGVIFCGRVQTAFELVNDPPWYDQWEPLYRAAFPTCNPDDPELCLASEVAQIWRVDHFAAIPVPRIPAWIRRSLFGRSTYGIVPSLALDPHPFMSDILRCPRFPVRAWTTDASEVLDRLKTDLVPASFEHLVVSLLQLKHPEEVWTQVGGSGDGGVDGIGADGQGHVIGMLQCKWAYHGGSVGWPEVWESSERGRRYIASLIHDPTIAPPDSKRAPGSNEFWSAEKIAKLVLKHAERLPLALSLRIGSSGRQ